MAVLKDAEKCAIVTLLARFTRPSDVVVYVRRHFGLEIDRFQVRSYDPTNPRYEGGAKWRPIFEAAREAYLSSIEAIPISHKGYRLNTLQQILDMAMRRGDVALAASILVQAAKEAGPISRSNGLVAPARSQAISTAEQRDEAMAAIIRKATARLAAPPPKAMG
jgi:hypothetical protein